METEWEKDSNCQDISMDQSWLTASIDAYSLSDFPFGGKRRPVSRWIADSQ